MTQELDSARLKQIRELRGLSQGELAAKARLNKQTVYRLEKGGRPTRPGTLPRLSQALDVETDVLTGEKPVPTLDAQITKPADDEKSQFKTRLDGAVRNAYSLIKFRYNIPPRTVAEYAPLLFVIAAETSLKRRQAKLEQFENALKMAGELVNNFPHLNLNKYDIRASEDEAISAEQDSIATKDIFAENLPGTVCPDWEPNPFFDLLQELTASIGGVAKLESASSRWAEYSICPSEAKTLAGGDQKIADELLAGTILIHQIPRELLAEERLAERIEWLRTQMAENDAKRQALSLEALDAAFEELDRDEDQL